MKLIAKGRFSVPLYHGTSSRFINSIKKHGLGAIDPFESSRETLAKLFWFVDSKFQNDPSWINKYKPSLEPYALQKSFNGFNFEHGQTYLTADREQAEEYASESPQGSEVAPEI